MSFNRLTVQSLQAARQRAAYSGLSGLGTTKVDATYFNRPSVDYVKAGDVIRVNFSWSNQLPASGNAEASFKAALQNAFNVLAVMSSRGWTFNGDITVDLQTRGDFAKLSDVVSIVASNANAAGLTVHTSGMRGEFISKVENTGGNVPSTLPDPRATPGGDSDSGLSDFFSNLTQSPTTLAVILGAAVILVIAAKK